MRRNRRHQQEDPQHPLEQGGLAWRRGARELPPPLLEEGPQELQDGVVEHLEQRQEECREDHHRHK